MNGVGFVAGSVVAFDGVALATTLRVVRRSSPRPVTRRRRSRPCRSSVNTPDGEVSNTAFVNVTAPPPVAITISPTSASVRVRQNKQFTATVQNTANTSVTWKVNGDRRREFAPSGRSARRVSTGRPTQCRIRRS